MHRRGQERQLIQSPLRASAHSSSHRHSPGALLAVVALLGAGVVGGVGCGDKDTTDVTPAGGTGGSAGSAGSAGRGGTAGTAGTAGTGGTAGTAGTAGTGGTGELPDAGNDSGTEEPDGGDSGPPAPSQREIVAQGICAGMAGVPDCTVPETCVQNQIDFQGYADFLPPACANEVQEFANCLSTQDADSFTCSDGITDIDYASNGCPDETAAFIAIGDGSNCPE